MPYSELRPPGRAREVAGGEVAKNKNAWKEAQLPANGMMMGHGLGLCAGPGRHGEASGFLPPTISHVSATPAGPARRPSGARCFVARHRLLACACRASRRQRDHPSHGVRCWRAPRAGAAGAPRDAAPPAGAGGARRKGRRASTATSQPRRKVGRGSVVPLRRTADAAPLRCRGVAVFHGGGIDAARSQHCYESLLAEKATGKAQVLTEKRPRKSRMDNYLGIQQIHDRGEQQRSSGAGTMGSKRNGQGSDVPA